MNSTKSRILIFFAIIGVCAVLFAGWRIYQEQIAQSEKHNFFSAPASTSSSAPDAFRSAPPPPQP